MTEETTLALVVIVAIIAVSPFISRYTRIPVIVIEMVAGIIIGKSLFDMIPSTPLFDFFSSFGLIYLMFLAGLEINLQEMVKNLKSTVLITIFSIGIPFGAGYGLSFYLGAHPLLIGTIFSTTSLGLILPIINELKGKEKFSHTLFGSVVLVDTLSIFILAFTLTYVKGNLSISFIYSFIFIILLLVIPMIMKKTKVKRKFGILFSRHTRFSIMTRISFAVLILLAALSENLGFHTIIGAFIAGLIISEFTHRASLLDKKLSSFGYGFFIPFFFIVVGSKINVPALFSNLSNLLILITIIVVAIASKVVGVFTISKVLGMDNKESLSMGFFHASRLSLIIAVGEIGFSLGLIDENLFSAFMLVAIVTALVGPLTGKMLLNMSLKDTKVPDQLDEDTFV